MKMISAAVLAGMIATGALAAPTVKIAILQDGVSPYFQSMAAEVKQEISLLLADDWNVTFLDGPDWTGDWQPVRAGDLLRAALEDPTVDLIYCGGLLLA
ncbi:MAG: hypothetical protein LC725_04200, partial [Lentisphaerae bacterium]|nr:hypothetical protein [Lentisphaerota bacterium]